MNPTKLISVVILPLPAQGHLNQLLHLARHISGHAIPVHYVGSTVHNRQARDRASINGHLDPSATTNLHFHDFPLPPYSTPPPNPNSHTNFPTHLQPAFDATARHLTAPLSSLLASLSASSRRVILIHDSTMSFAAGVASAFANTESYVFHSVSAYTNVFFHLQTLHQRDCSDSNEKLTFEGCFSDEFTEFLRKQHRMTVKDHGRILNTCRKIEGEFLDRLSSQPNWKDQKVFAVGPLNPIAVDCGRRRQHECLDWLDRQPDKSAVYVSFGTTSSLSKDQILELAKGLEASKQKYIWVLRAADRGDIYATATAEDEKENTTVNDCGMIVRGWAPQLEILAHRATGGFLTHCGWNSCMESMSMGVPMLAWPMHSDQPRNAVLVTEVLRAGIVARPWDKRIEVLAAGSIRDAIVRLMVEDEGREVARRAMEVGEVIRECGRKKAELDSFIAYITR